MKRLLYILLVGLSVAMLAGCGSSGSGGNTPAKDKPVAPKQTAATPQPTAVPSGVPVLMYHKIGDEKNNDAVISEELFAAQMDFLKKNGYNPITMDELYAYMTEKKPLPLKPLVITFDDGYRDTYEIAMPILKKHGFRSMMFIPASDVGKNINWNELREMKAAGMDIGSHSYTHTDLEGMSKQKQTEEITKAKETFDRELKQDTKWFCYPYGGYDNTTRAIMKEKGITMSVTMNPGWAKYGDDPLVIKRIWVGNKVTLKYFEERISKADYTSL